MQQRRYYRDEDLIQVAATSNCMTAFINQLGVPSTSGRRSYLRSRLLQLGVDLSHWDHSRSRLYSTDDLAKAVARSFSFAGVLRELGVRQAGGSQSYLAIRIRREGLDTSHFTGRAHGKGLVGRRRPPGELLVELAPGSNRAKAHMLKRAMIESGVAHRCAACGLAPEWNDKPLTLVIDHINGDWLDNRLPNVRFLCPNCHAQTATWCRKKGP